MPVDPASRVPRVTAPAVDMWAVIDEFGRLLDIFGGQLDYSLQGADREYMVVGEAFDRLAAAKAAIGAVDCPEPGKSTLQREAGRIGDSLHAAVMGLQYHDRLSQRLGHIRAGLDRLKRVLRDGKERSSTEWLQLLQAVEQAHQVEQQRLIGLTAPAGSPDTTPGTATNGTVELF